MLYAPAAGEKMVYPAFSAGCFIDDLLRPEDSFRTLCLGSFVRGLRGGRRKGFHGLVSLYLKRQYFIYAIAI
ncbi:MAG: hypothetical protein ACQGQP_00145 [Desulfovibrio sp.]